MGKNLLDLEHKLNYYFNDKNLLKKALIHRSYGNEVRKYKNINNERLELLGDSVLELVVVEYIFKKYKNYNEGSLAKIKSMCVSEPILAEISRKMKIGNFLLISKGEELAGGKNRDSILADAFEAILGAIYLDSNLSEAKDFVLYHLKEKIDNIEHDENILDYKTLLQEHVQKEYKFTPEYTVLSESGPDHLKEFIIKVMVNKKFGIGRASNKKKAQQLAAKDLYKKMGLKW